MSMFVTGVCPVCSAPQDQPCNMCEQSMALILSKTLPKCEPPAEVRESQPIKKNIASGEDVCFA
jgi:hypothetical protein